MTQATTTSPAPQAERRIGRSLWADAALRIARDKGAMICLGIILLYALVALGGGIYEAYAAHDKDDAYQTFTEMGNRDRVQQAPTTDLGWKYWLGADWSGRSVLIEMFLGAKVSLLVGLMANIIAVPFGMLLGAIAGYYGKWIDSIVIWVYSTLSSIPGLILLIAIKYAFQGVKIMGMDLTGTAGLIIALAVTSWVGTCRLVRAETLKLRELDYVQAARACGRGGFSILLRHIIPNVFHIGVINFSLGFVGAITAEVTLSYLGLGVSVGTPSWGQMISGSQMDLVAGRWWRMNSAVGAMFFIVLALNIFGDRLRDALDPKLKNV